MTKFVLGVDIDGVIADYTTGFAEFVAARRGISSASLPKRKSYDFSEWGVTDTDSSSWHRVAAIDDRMLVRLSVIPDASEVLWRLSDEGVWVRVITHRLYYNWGHVVTVTDTVNWLDDNNIPYRDICFLGDKPEVGADLYVDDAPHNIVALRTNGSEAIVFDQPYNRDLPAPRATNWLDVEKYVMKRLASMENVDRQMEGLV